MNKNFIRAIKREYKAFYDDFISKEGLKNTKSHLIKNTELFASELLANTSIRWWEVDGFNTETLRDYLMALTQYCMYKKIYVSKQGAEIREQVYNLLYSYSHVRFYDFISVPEIKVLILMLRERYSKREFASLATSSNLSAYESHIESIIRNIKLSK